MFFFIESLFSRVALFYLFELFMERYNFTVIINYHYYYTFLINSFSMFRGRLSEHDKNLQLTKISNKTQNGLNQGDTIQKQIESYTRKFEEEKRKLFRAQENHREILKDYQQKVHDLSTLKAEESKLYTSNLSSKIKCLQISVQKGISAYNEALSRNNSLKSEIDELRKQKKNEKEAFRQLQQKIEELGKGIKEMESSIEGKKTKVQKVKEEILGVKIKNQQQNQEYLNCIQMLKQDENLIKQSMKNTSQKQPTETSDTQPIVKLRIRNIIHQNKEKIRIAELYKKNMEKIQQSFEEIKRESGISDLQQITKTFLKQEQQNSVIFQYIHKLTTELEIIKEQNERLEKKILRHEEEIYEYRKLIDQTPEKILERSQLKFFHSERQKHIDTLQQFLASVQPSILKILNIQNTQEGKLLNHLNIENYLAQIEQMIDKKLQDQKVQVVGVEVKDEFTKYTKPLPMFGVEQLRDKGEDSLLQHPKFREFACEYWEKKKQLK